MQNTRRIILSVGLSLALAAGTVACGGDSSSSTKETTEMGITTTAVIIDVRTAEEYAEGHVEGAVNYDVNGPDFAAQLAALDPEGQYVVYCRSGNRSGIAVGIMKQAGIKNITDLLTLENASAELGRPIVKA